MPARTKFIDYDARREPRTDRWCIACQRDLDPARPHRFVYVTASYHAVHPDDLNQPGPLEGDFGWKRIGQDCAKKLGVEWTTLAPIGPPFSPQAQSPKNDRAKTRHLPQTRPAPQGCVAALPGSAPRS